VTGVAKDDGQHRLVGPAVVAWAAAWLGTGGVFADAGGWWGAGAGAAAAVLLAAGLVLVRPRPDGSDHGDPHAAQRPGSDPQRRSGPGRWPGHPRRRRAPAAPALGWLLLACVLVASAAAVGGHARWAAARAGPLDELAAQRGSVTVVAQVQGDPAPATANPSVSGDEPSRYRVPVTVVAVLGAPPSRASGSGGVIGRQLPDATQAPQRHTMRASAIVVGDGSWGAVAVGSTVQAKVRVTPPWSGGSVMAVLLAADAPTVVSGPAGAFAAAEPLRAAIRDAVAGLAPGPRGLVPALVDGDESRMPPQLTADLRASGLAHLTAVSGANVTYVVGSAVLLARWVLAPRLVQVVVGLLATGGFVLLARAEPSVVRAAVMGGVAVLGLFWSSSRGGARLLWAVVTMVLLADPWLARSLGFALSVAATAGILLATRRLTRALSWMPSWLAFAVAVPLAAQLATAPVLTLIAPQASLVGVPANLAAGLAVGPTTVLGLLAGLAGLAHPSAGSLLGVLAGVPASWIVAVAETAAAMPGAVVGLPAGTLGTTVIAVGCGLLVWVLPRLLRHRALSIAGLAVLLLAVTQPARLTGWPPRDWLVIMCDVGQGDAVLVRVDTDAAIVVDAGPQPASLSRCLATAGVRTVPLLVLTHFHADHIGGLAGVGRRPVGQVLVSPWPAPDQQARDVQVWASRRGLSLRPVSPPERWRVGDAHVDVVWPTRLVDAGDQANQASVTVVVRTPSGERLLLTGDLEAEAQRSLLARVGIPAVDVVKVPHHGSANQYPPFLLAARPRVALVSAGSGNPYGHPAPATLDLLKRAGVTVGRTDTQGALAVVAADDGTVQLVAGAGR
jgi:competence protein ComEC